jgi:multiple sugar transport system permease protein
MSVQAPVGGATGTIAKRRTQSKMAGQRLGLAPYLFILPHLIFFAVFLAWPFFFGLYTSLYQYDFLRPEFRPFVGLDNYLRLFNSATVQSREFWLSIRNTGEFILWSVVPLVVGGLFLALILNGRFRGRNLFRMTFFAPYTLSVTAAAILWWWLFQSQGGLVNTLFQQFGLPRVNWLSSMPQAWIAITVATIWWTVGFNTIIFLAALQEIPAELYEAAAIDGANTWQRFRHVTMPLLRPVTVLVITITLIASANLFGQPYLMTAGGPVQRTETVIYRIVVEGLNRHQMGSAAAMSILLAAGLMVLTALNFKFFGRSESA